MLEGSDTVIAWKIGGKICYAVEGYAAVTGSAVQWFRDGMKLIKKSSEIEALAESVSDTNGVYFVPALTGLGAPYWDPFARGMIIGITRGTTDAHVARAVLTSIAFSIRDITDAIETHTGSPVKDVRIDGGASENNLLAQMFADYLNCKIARPASVEATSLGAATCGPWHRFLEDGRSGPGYDLRCGVRTEDACRAAGKGICHLQRRRETVLRLDERQIEIC